MYITPQNHTPNKFLIVIFYTHSSLFHYSTVNVNRKLNYLEVAETCRWPQCNNITSIQPNCICWSFLIYLMHLSSYFLRLHQRIPSVSTNDGLIRKSTTVTFWKKYPSNWLTSIYVSCYSTYRASCRFSYLYPTNAQYIC